ncbi:hypothetical protein QBC35DRAFT_99963 [Podospora australis]|uniref:CFEM domain-containing protein n=1 Tax=Podospora australis TaxID=1536484 RepID=A0AAN7ALK7_9PEZI|nr:hypothetical protein QBC35DRAFT_99963 [Podospora australis]
MTLSSSLSSLLLSFKLFRLPLLLSFSLLLSLTQAQVPVSISSYAPYLNQRACVKDCLWRAGTTEDLIGAIGCSDPWVNECFCHSEAASSASSFVSSCVADKCNTAKTGNVPIITSALSVYNGYCSTNGFSIPTVASIKSFDGYLKQTECVQLCLWHSGQIEDDLMPNMGCGAPWDNSCLCDASRVADKGKAFLSTCVASRCATGSDGPVVTSALSVLGVYCSSAGLPVTALAFATSTTFTSLTTAITSGPTPTPTTGGPLIDGEPRPAESQATGLSTGAIVGIAVASVAVVLASLAAVALFIYKRREARNHTDTETHDLTDTPSPQPGEKVLSPLTQIFEKQTDQEVVEADQGIPVERYEMPGRERSEYAAELAS